MTKQVRRIILVGVFVLVVISLLMSAAYIEIDRSTLVTLQVDGVEIQIIYDLDSNPLQWVAGVGGLIWEATGPRGRSSGRLSGQQGYDFWGDAIVEVMDHAPGRFSVTDWESKQKTDWQAVVQADGSVTVHEADSPIAARD